MKLISCACLLASSTFFLDKDEGGGGGGDPKPKGTLEEQLAQSRKDLAAAQSSIGSLTKERDDAKGEAAKITGQFDALTQTANSTKTELGTVTGERDTLKGQLSTVTGERDAASANVARLEKLCGVKGIDPKTAVPAAEQPNGGSHVYDQWSNATGAEKTRLWRAHKSEIRAEGERRDKEAKRD